MPPSLSVSFEGQPQTLNPLVHKGKHLATATIMAPVLHSLLQVRHDGHYRGQLATSVPRASEGGRFLFYRLRDDAAWHDGAPVCSGDVRFTWELMLDRTSGVPERDGYDLISRIRDLSDREFVVELTRPYSAAADLFTSTTGAIMPEHLLREVDFDSDWPEELRPASGPYRIQKRTDSELVLRRNPHYSPASSIEEIVVRFATTDAERAALMVRGDLDVATFDSLDMARAAVENSSSPLTLATAPSAQFEVLLFNTRKGAFASRGRRRAWAAGLDRRAIAAETVGGEPLEALLRRPGDEGFEPAFAHLTIPDNDQEKQAVEEGSDPRADVLRLMAVPTPARKIAARQIVRFAERSQTKLAIEWVRPQDFLSRLHEGQFDAALIGLVGNPDPAGHATLWRSVQDGGQNYAGIADKAIDAALSQLMGAVDPHERNRAVRAAERALANAVPAIPLFTYPTVLVHHNALVGPAPYPYQSGHLVEVEAWRWTGDRSQWKGGDPWLLSSSASR